MTSPIEPALSAEEWAVMSVQRGRECQEDGFNASVERSGGLPYLRIGNRCIESDSDHYTPDELMAIVALANAALPDDDPRKITWAVVDKLREASDVCYEKTLTGIADALASYLPPRTP